MSNKCSNCEYLLSVINSTKLKIKEIKESNNKVKDNCDEIIRIIHDLNKEIDELKEQIKCSRK